MRMPRPASAASASTMPLLTRRLPETATGNLAAVGAVKRHTFAVERYE
jgi:hypothetical protein